MQRTPFIQIVANHLKAPIANVQEDEVLLNYERSVCKVTLNRPKALNSLNVEMVRTLSSELSKWNSNSSLKVVIFKGAGKAFCSGADLMRLYKSEENPATKDYAESFFKETYTFHLGVSQMKPIQIVFWDGFIMGGGVGLSINAPIRIATENALFSMPEGKVGTFTEGGGGYFLSKLRNNLGMFLALTAAHLKGKQLVQVGVADFYVKRENLEKLEQDIIQNTKPDTTLEELRSIVRKYEEPVERKFPNEDLIKDIFGKESVEKIYNALKQSEVNKEFTQKIVSIMDTLSPISMKISFEQLRRGKELDLRENLKMDMRLIMRVGGSHDSKEGVRTTLVDRNSKPKWQYPTIFDTPQESIDKCFEKLESHREIL